MPCMNASGMGVTPQFVRIAKAFGASGKPVAAQRGSVGALSGAGLLKGRTYADYFRIEPEGTWVSTGVVQDGNIITSAGCPYSAAYEGTSDGTVELTQKFINSLAI